MAYPSRMITAYRTLTALAFVLLAGCAAEVEAPKPVIAGDIAIEAWPLPAMPGTAQPDLSLAPDGRLPQRAREGLQVMRYQYPEPVRSGRLKTRLGVGPDLDLALSGTFGPDGTASGDIDLATNGGTRCSGKTKATWKATRK